MRGRDIEDNIVRGRDIQDHIVRGRDIQDHIVRGRDIEDNIVRGRDIQDNIVRGRDIQDNVGYRIGLLLWCVGTDRSLAPTPLIRFSPLKERSRSFQRLKGPYKGPVRRHAGYTGRTGVGPSHICHLGSTCLVLCAICAAFSKRKTVRKGPM